MDALKDIKNKVISDFNNLLYQLNIGKSPCYEHILEKISFIEIGSELSNPTSIYEKLGGKCNAG